MLAHASRLPQGPVRIGRASINKLIPTDTPTIAQVRPRAVKRHPGSRHQFVTTLTADGRTIDHSSHSASPASRHN